MNSWMEVVGQWRQGIVYPHWAALAQYGYGEARFIFYPPASWTLGAALGALLPWKAVPGVYVWFALTLSGCYMILLSRQWLELRDAMFAAALYAANPYYIVIVYWRSAFAELLAGALLPLLLLYGLRCGEEEEQAIIPLGLIVAAAWLTNIPAAVMVNYSLALLIVMLAVREQSPRVLFCGALAGFLGAALAAFFLLPAAYEGRWVNISEVLSPGVRPLDNFLFTTINDADHNRFNLLISLVAFAEMIVLATAIFFSRQYRRKRPQLWYTTVGWALLAVLLNLVHLFPMDASARVALRATSLALAVVPECNFRAAGDHGFAAMDFTIVSLSCDVGGARFRVASRPTSVVGDGGGFCRDA